MATDYSALQSDVRNYIAETTLMIALKETKFHQFGQKARLPNRHGKTFLATRYERLVLPQTPLSDGQTPSNPIDLTISQVTCTADQWGMFVTITDVAELTIAHSPFQKALDLLGYNQAELVDREIQKVLISGTNVFYGDALTVTQTRASVTTSMYPTDIMIRAIVASLRAYGARGLEKPENPMEDPEMGEAYVGILDPYNEMDLIAMTDFKLWKQYKDPEKAWNGEVGEIYGVRFVRSNFIPTIQGHAKATVSPSNTGGFLNSTDGVYIVHVTMINDQTGFEDVICLVSDTVTFSSSGNVGKITVTVPTVTGHAYGNVYMTTDGGSTAYFIAKAAAGAYDITTDPVGTEAVAPPLVNSASTKLHTIYFVGKEAYTVVDLQDLETYITPATASDSDPLVQRRKVGWKRMFKSVINNQNFMARWEIESQHD